MSASWIVEVPAAELKADVAYFLGKVGGMDSMDFAATNLSGKSCWSQKPGLAREFYGDDQFKKVLADHPEFRAVTIPADAAKRWRARKAVRGSWRRKK